MRIATYNIEWFNSLFDDDGALLFGNAWSSRWDVTRHDQTTALGHVFQALDADIVAIIEGPDHSKTRSAVTALETFADHFELRARKALIGFANETQQEIALLFDPDVVTAVHDPIGSEAGKQGIGPGPRFDETFSIDLDVDATEDLIRFSKPPLEVALRTNAGFAFRMIGVHAKSKAPHGAKSDEEVMRISIANRRKQLAQCIWLRQRVEHHLNAGDPLIVAGDFNDGPGLDEYEKLFGRSSVEIVLGDDKGPNLFDPHARMALTQRMGVSPTSSRFYIRHEKRYLQALLDYIMVSQDLNSKRPKWCIWHPFDDLNCYTNAALRDALLTASDHFPVTLDIEI